MPQSLSNVFVHITFSTKYRENLIDDSIKEKLFGYLGGTCKGLDCLPISVGGHLNHVHVLSILSKKITQVDFLMELKKSSSKWIKTQGREYSNFYWQDGYSIFSVSPNEIDNVARYIRNQEEHHGHRTFEEELLALLRLHNIDFDEKYLRE
jgi:putative transposase